MVYLVGDPMAGFELLSTRYYGGSLLDAYQDGHGYRVGVLDFRHGEVDRVSHSRLFNPNRFAGFLPVNLVPDDEYWGFQYLAGGYRQASGYNSGSYDYYDGDYVDNDGYYSRGYEAGYSDVPSFKSAPGTATSSLAPATGQRFSNEGNIEYETKAGVGVALSRKVHIEHLNDAK